MTILSVRQLERRTGYGSLAITFLVDLGSLTPLMGKSGATSRSGRTLRWPLQRYVYVLFFFCFFLKLCPFIYLFISSTLPHTHIYIHTLCRPRYYTGTRSRPWSSYIQARSCVLPLGEVSQRWTDGRLNIMYFLYSRFIPGSLFIVLITFICPHTNMF